MLEYVTQYTAINDQSGRSIQMSTRSSPIPTNQQTIKKSNYSNNTHYSGTGIRDISSFISNVKPTTHNAHSNLAAVCIIITQSIITINNIMFIHN